MATGQPLTATRKAAFQTAQRSLSYLLVRYAPVGAECSELEKLVTEFAETNADLFGGYPVNIVYSNISRSVFKRTRGCAVAGTSTPEQAIELLEALKSAPQLLPSGRPTMESTLKNDQLGVFLTASPTDPYVTKFDSAIETISQKLHEIGTVERLNVVKRRNWPAGNIFCDFKEDDAANKAVDMLDGINVPDLDMPLQVMVAKFKPHMGDSRIRTEGYARF